MDEPAVRIQGLAKHYGDVAALRSLDLEVPRGSVFGFLGPNGSGKTTAMRILMGLVRPTSGSAQVLGRDVVRDSVAIRQRVGYLAQRPTFYDELSARANLRFARGFYPPDPDRRVDDAVDEVLSLVGLEGTGEQAVGGFSGGQRQRLGIAQAQIHRPELLVLDEPASALDPLGRRDVLGILERLRGVTTVLYSTHILDDVQRVSDAVAILHHGERVAQASMSELLAGDATVYRLALAGEAAAVIARLEAEPWVAHVHAERRHGDTLLRVTVTDDEVAARQLLRLVVAHEEVVVHSFDRHRSELEDVFVQLVEGVAT